MHRIEEFLVCRKSMDALDHDQNVNWLAKFVDDANVNEIIIMSYCSVCFYKEFVVHGGSLFSYIKAFRAHTRARSPITTTIT